MLTKGASLHIVETELFVDGRLISCSSHSFMIRAWCLETVKKAQQQTLELCETTVASLFSGRKHSDGDTVFLKRMPKVIRMKDVELTMARLAALVAKPRAQEPHSALIGPRTVKVW